MEVKGTSLKSEDWQSLKENYGPEVEKFLLDCRGISRKTKTGALIVKYQNDLKICQNIQETTARTKKLPPKPEKKYDTNKPKDFEAIPGAEVLEHEYDDDVSLYYDFRRVTEFGDIIEQKFNLMPDYNYLSDDSGEETEGLVKKKIDTEIDQLIETIEGEKGDNEAVQEVVLFNADDCNNLPSSEEIFLKMFNNQVLNFNDKTKISSLIPILSQLLEHHKVFDYFAILRDYYNPTEESDEMSVYQVIEFFSIILIKVVPKELFGSCRNKKLLFKMIKKYLKNPLGSEFPYYMLRILHPENIPWLDEIEDELTKHTLTILMTKWFIDFYIMGILNSVFMVTKATSSTKKIFYPDYLWKEKKRNFYQEMKRTGVFVEEKSCDLSPPSSSDNFKPTEAILRLYPKKRNLRPIYTVINDTTDNKYERTMIKKLLLQLYRTKFESFVPGKMYDVWKNVIQQHKNSKSSYYFVTTDIESAYPSIDQNKLLDIINKLMLNLPRVMTYRLFYILKSAKGTNRPLKYLARRQEFFVTSDDTLVVPLPAGALVCELGCKQMRTVWLQEKIVSFILCQVVLLGQKRYILKKGVAQGISFSSIFSEIYYATMIEQVFGDIKKRGTLVRYVDDFFYITQEQSAAEKFLEYVNQGIPDFNCKFSVNKTHTNLTKDEEEEKKDNLPIEKIKKTKQRKKNLKSRKRKRRTVTETNTPIFYDSSPFSRKQKRLRVENKNCFETKPKEKLKKNEFSYLGNIFNIDNFQVKQEYLKCPIEYLMVWSKVAPDEELQTFYQRLLNMHIFKLEPLVLDPAINSSEQIEETLKKVGLIAGRKLFVLLLNIFKKSEYLQTPMIWLIIRKFVYLLIRIITKKFPMNREKRENLEIIIWSSINKVFSNNIALRQVFGRKIKSQMKKFEL